MSHLTCRSFIASAFAASTLANNRIPASAQTTPSASPMPLQIPDAMTLEDRLVKLFPSLNVPGVLVLVQHPAIGTCKGAFGVSDLSTSAPLSGDLNFRIGTTPTI